MHQRSESLYESQIMFGQSGPYFMLNLIQICAFMLIFWIEIMFNHFRIEIVETYSNLSYIFLITGAVFYFIIQLAMTSLSLKWLTLISSVRYNI